MSSPPSAVAAPAARILPLLQLAAALGTRDLNLVREGMISAKAEHLENEVGEVILMALFVTGFPAGLQAAEAWSELRSSPPPAESEPEVDFTTRGRLSCAAVYGSQFEGLLEGLAHLHPDLPELVVSLGYGRMMSRPVLPVALRELCLIAMLVPWQAETQLYSHLRGALLVGASEGEVDDAVAAGLSAATKSRQSKPSRVAKDGSEVAPDADPDKSVAAIWDRVRSRRQYLGMRDGET